MTSKKIVFSSALPVHATFNFSNEFLIQLTAFHTLLIEAILVLLICVGRIETLGSLETFDLREILRHLSYVCLSVRPSVCSTHDCVRTQRATNFKPCK